MSVIYIAGPMAGIPEHNFPAFNAAAESWRLLGHEVFNPAEKEEEENEQLAVSAPFDNSAENLAKLRVLLAKDMKVICEECDMMVMLKGWEKSYGARAEHALAVALGLEIVYQ